MVKAWLKYATLLTILAIVLLFVTKLSFGADAPKPQPIAFGRTVEACKLVGDKLDPGKNDWESCAYAILERASQIDSALRQCQASKTPAPEKKK